MIEEECRTEMPDTLNSDGIQLDKSFELDDNIVRS